MKKKTCALMILVLSSYLGQMYMGQEHADSNHEYIDTASVGFSDKETDSQMSASLSIDWERTRSCAYWFVKQTISTLMKPMKLYINSLAYKSLKALGTYISTLSCTELTHCSSIRESLPIISTSVQWYFSCDEHEDSHVDSILTPPCYSVHFTSWHPSARVWYIGIPRVFMINITILHAYVPFSARCHLHAISVYNGHDETNNNLMDYFCGTLKYESVYSKLSKAMITLNVTMAMKIDAAYLKAQYASLIQGQAYKFINPSCILHGIKTKIQPSFALYISQKLHYFWYLSNKVFHYHGLKQPNPTRLKPFDLFGSYLLHQYIDVNESMCSSKHVSLDVFAGLLPFYWWQWRSKPYATLNCSSTNKTRVDIAFHMHATLVLTLDPWAEEHELHMTLHFGNGIKHLGRFLCYDCAHSRDNVRKALIRMDGQNLAYKRSYGRSHVEIYNFKAQGVSIQKMDYTGDTTTIRPQLVNRGLDLNTTISSYVQQFEPMIYRRVVTSHEDGKYNIAFNE